MYIWWFQPKGIYFMITKSTLESKLKSGEWPQQFKLKSHILQLLLVLQNGGGVGPWVGALGRRCSRLHGDIFCLPPYVPKLLLISFLKKLSMVFANTLKLPNPFGWFIHPLRSSNVEVWVLLLISVLKKKKLLPRIWSICCLKAINCIPSNFYCLEVCI